jgi:anti-sigma factor RsiW
MNDPTQLPPCAEFEYELVELDEGSLEPERARAVRAHLESCARCRAWAAAFARFDAGLAAAMPQPTMSADFDARLAQRIAAETRRMPVVNLRRSADTEYRRMLEALRSQARRNALLTGAAVAVVAVVALVVLTAVWPEAGEALAALEPARRAAMFGAFGAAIALAGLGWSALKGALPGVRLGA